MREMHTTSHWIWLKVTTYTTTTNTFITTILGFQHLHYDLHQHHLSFGRLPCSGIRSLGLTHCLSGGIGTIWLLYFDESLSCLEDILEPSFFLVLDLGFGGQNAGLRSLEMPSFGPWKPSLSDLGNAQSLVRKVVSFGPKTRQFRWKMDHFLNTKSRHFSGLLYGKWPFGWLGNEASKT